MNDKHKSFNGCDLCGRRSVIYRLVDTKKETPYYQCLYCGAISTTAKKFPEKFILSDKELKEYQPHDFKKV